MAQEMKEKVGGVGAGTADARKEAMKKGRQQLSLKVGLLSDEEKQARKTVLSARQVLDSVAARILDRKPIRPEIIRACGAVISASADSLFD